jgi:hypothetical protein
VGWTKGAAGLAVAAMALAAGAATAQEPAREAARPPQVLLLAEPNQPELEAQARALIDALPAGTARPGVPPVSPRLFKDCVFLIGPNPVAAEDCAAPVIETANRDGFAETVAVLVAGMSGGWRRWTCLGGGYPVQAQIGPADTARAVAIVDGCVSSAYAAFTQTRRAWVQASAIAPGERDYPRGYSGWVRGADIGVGRDRGEHVVEVLQVGGGADGEAWKLSKLSIRCGRAKYQVLGRVSYGADGRERGTQPGGGEYLHIYDHTAEADLETAVCRGRTATGAATADSVAEAVARGVPVASPES